MYYEPIAGGGNATPWSLTARGRRKAAGGQLLVYEAAWARDTGERVLGLPRVRARN